MIGIENKKRTEMMTIWRFLDWKKPAWATSPSFTSVVFREIGQLDSYKYLFIGKRCPLAFSLQRETMPDRFKYIPDAGGLMGVLMDMSIQFNLYKVAAAIDEYDICKYTVWISKVEPDQEHNIDADMVENFTRKVFPVNE